MSRALRIVSGCVAVLGWAGQARAACGIAVSGEGVEVGCLPALSADRRAVLVPIVDPDGGRGNPNLTVGTLPIGGGAGTQATIVSGDEWDQLPPPERVKRAAPRIAAVDAQLGAAPTRLREILEGEDRAEQARAGGGYALVQRQGRVTIRRGGATLATVSAPAAAGKGACRSVNEPWLQSLFVEGEVAALRFAFHGNDSCWEPPPVWVVTRLAAGPPEGRRPDPAAATAANGRGMKRYREHDWAGAAAEFKAAIAADPRHVRAHYNLACVSALAGDKVTALAELRALAASPDPLAKDKLRKGAADPDLAALKDDPDARRLLSESSAPVPVPAPVPASVAPAVPPAGPPAAPPAVMDGNVGKDAAAARGNDPETLWTTESVGPLRIGMTAQAIFAELGQPKRKTAAVREDASGTWVSGWSYDGLDLSLEATTRKGAPTLRAITVRAPSRLGCWGVTIGSTVAELARAFPRSMWNAEESTDERVTIGSVYGGILFSLARGKVSEIFVGAAAE